MSGIIEASAAAVEHRLSELESQYDLIRRNIETIREEASHYVLYKDAHPDEHPFTHLLDNAESDLERADFHMSEVIRYIESASYFALRLNG
ncbi:hypothetical protein QN355_19800 [Cryobacterium sp. 10S3]|uniref:hypothetical protein n=1 Tax=Cryobacterium sp. 10S3 TaxID=3048582 RepID=UPI002AC8CD9E|nr:hypothetical protein [Cryobacterium sp. 10S3]MEB0288776.1 hypothetical protein [Cryobacterium sp. 10S3]WPX14206.1 hypothetical protein RHM57_02185 [Cryobacterium sp. 10S3]